MPQFKVPQPDGDIEVSYYDGGLVESHTWHVKDGVVHVGEDKVDFFLKHVTGAQATAGETKPEEASPVKESSKAK